MTQRVCPTGIRIVVWAVLTCLVCGAVAAGDFNRPWQQEVNYWLDVTLEPDGRTIDGSAVVQYINNSPDTLPVLYFKAFANACQPGSYADSSLRRRLDQRLSHLTPLQQGSLTLRQPDSSVIDLSDIPYRVFEVKNTIVSVYLNRALLPGDTVVIPFEFTTVLPKPAAMRMGVSGAVTKAVYWYPQACVYDHRAGWVNAQYVGNGENYGDYGRYEVTITAPDDMVVAATGVCVNESEVLPDSLRDMLALANFLEPREEWPKFQFDTSATRTWRYEAEHVNDFAFSASNQWCLVSDTASGAEVIAYALRNKAEAWQDAAQKGAEAIRLYSELVYPYQYPVMRICDAFSGMEYAMLTNAGSGAPNPRFDIVIYHEVGHQWFMQMVGSNPRIEPFMDEGFTQFLETMAMEHYRGREATVNHPSNWYERQFGPVITEREGRSVADVLRATKQGYLMPLAVEADANRDYMPWVNTVYDRGVLLHLSLMSILGDAAYFDALNFYCDRWLYGHPYSEDFAQALEDATGLQFESYLAQWYYDTPECDYAFEKKSTSANGDVYDHKIKLERRKPLVAPVDVAVIWEQGDTTLYTVPPEGMGYRKPGYVLLPVWKQFRLGDDKYEFTVSARRKINEVVVDPFELLPDIDRRNNASGWILAWPVEVRFDNLLYDHMPANEYAIRWRPIAWYDDANGAMLGGHLRGSYLDVEDRFALDVMVGTESGEVMLDVSYSSPVTLLGPQSEMTYRYLQTDRRSLFRQSTTKRFKPLHAREDGEYFGLVFDYLTNPGKQANLRDTLPTELVEYLPDPAWDAVDVATVELTDGSVKTWLWGDFRFVNREMLGAYKQDGAYAGFLKSQFAVQFGLKHRSREWLQLRAEYMRTDGDAPSQYLEHLSRASGIDAFAESWLFRSPGTFPTDWQDEFYLANNRVRGYQNRLLYLLEFYGGTIELTPPDLLPYRWLGHIPLAGGWLGACDQSLFVDGGQMSFDERESSYRFPISVNESAAFGEDDGRWFVSAGVSLHFPPVWQGQTVRLDFPVYLNEPVRGEEELDFRFSAAWLLPLEL